jgi:hypothetical protein
MEGGYAGATNLRQRERRGARAGFLDMTSDIIKVNIKDSSDIDFLYP